VILGLDISTSITGYAIINLEGKLQEVGSWDMRNKNHFPDMFSKSLFIKEKLKEIDYPIDHIFIEPALNMFMMGKSSSHTISTLIKFNGITSWMCFEEFGIQPQFIPAISARKKCGITIKRGTKAKEQVFKFMIDNEPQFGYTVEYTKHGNPKPQYYDRADALVMARAGLVCLTENSK
jgi:Holliday junction resolvasome RuvABC endonuclease subunit